MNKLLSLAYIISLSVFTPSSFAFVAENSTTPSSSFNAEIQNRININLASVDELAQLKGVGFKKAQAIVDYRESHGEFDSIDSLIAVKGIGEKVIADNKSRLTL